MLHRILRGAFWTALGWVVARGAALVSTVAVARMLGREGYGEVGMVQSTIELLGVLAGLGLGTAATRQIADSRVSDPARAGRVLTLTGAFALAASCAMAVACTAGAPLLATRLLHREVLAPLLAQGALLLILSTLGGVCTAALSGFEDFRAAARVVAVQGLCTPLVALPFVHAWGVQGAVASMTVVAGVGLALQAAALRAACRRGGVPLSTNGVWGERALLWRYAFPALLSALVTMPVLWGTNVLLARSPEGFGELGLFNAANQWRMLVVVLPGFLSAALLPVLSQQHGASDREGFRSSLGLSFRLTMAVGLPLAVGVIVLCEPLARLFGRDFHGAGPVTALLMAAMFLYLVAAVVGAALGGAGRMWVGLTMNVLWGCAMLGAAVALVPLYGARGLAGAYLVAYVAHAGWAVAYLVLRVAPGALRGQWATIAFCGVVLAASVGVGLATTPAAAARAVLLFAASLPLLGLLRDARRHVAAIAA